MLLSDQRVTYFFFAVFFAGFLAAFFVAAIEFHPLSFRIPTKEYGNNPRLQSSYKRYSFT